MTVKKETINSGVVIWQDVSENAMGGFTLNDAAFAAGVTVAKGTPIGFDESTRIAMVAKVAVAQAPATNSATQYRVKKGHLLKVGSQIKAGSSGAQAITAIDTSNADYDQLTVGTTLGVAVAVGDAIFVDDAGYQNVKGLLYEDVEIDAKGITDVAVVLRATVYERRIAPLPATIKAKTPHIIYSQSF